MKVTFYFISFTQIQFIYLFSAPTSKKAGNNQEQHNSAFLYCSFQVSFSKYPTWL